MNPADQETSPQTRREAAGFQSESPRRRRWFPTNAAINGGIVLFNAILVALLWTFVSATLRDERVHTIAAAVQRNDHLVIAVEQYVIRTIESADAIIRYLIHEHAQYGRNTDLARLVKEFTVDYSAIHGVALMNERGDVVTMSYGGDLAGPTNVADREYFKIHLAADTGAPVVGKPITGRVTGDAVIPVTRRINKPDGSFGGVAMALIGPGRFTDVLRDARMLPLDVISIVGLDGITRARLVGPAASSGQDISRSPLFAAVAAARVGNLSSAGQLDGVARQYSYRMIGDYGLLAIVGRADSDILADFNVRRRQYFWSAGLASALVGGFAALLMFALWGQRRAAATVIRNSGRFMAAFDQAAVGIAHLDMSGRYVEVNDRLCDILGYSRSELLERNYADITHAHDLPKGAGFHDRVQEAGDPPASVEREKRYLRKDRSVVWCAVSLSAVKDDSGRVEYVLAVVQDISSRRGVEEALRERGARLQRLSRQLMEAQEQERRRLGRELHDRVGANLSAAVLTLEVLRGMPEAPARDSRPRIDDCVLLLRETIAQVREVLTDLRPPALDELGLFAALGYYVRSTAQRANIDIRMAGRDPATPLPTAMQISLFRIAQEAISNAVRHAGAMLITVSLTQDAAGTRLSVVDDGKGYDMAAPTSASASLGMLTMRERAEAAGGHLTVEASPGGGASIEVFVPMATPCTAQPEPAEQARRNH